MSSNETRGFWPGVLVGILVANVVGAVMLWTHVINRSDPPPPRVCTETITNGVVTSPLDCGASR